MDALKERGLLIRTGLVVMLIQAVLGLSKEEMLTDYHESERAMTLKTKKTNSTASDEALAPGKLDRRIFASAPRDILEQTWEWLDEQYDNGVFGYLDQIGFDVVWRLRLCAAIKGQPLPPSQTSRTRSCPSKLWTDIDT